MKITQDMPPPQSPQSAAAEILKAGRYALLGVGVFTAIINILMLTSSLFMLQVYDRVIPSHSVPTLLGLVGIIVFLYAFLGIFDAIRSRLLVRIGLLADRRLGRYAYEAIVTLPLVKGPKSSGLQPIRDLDQIRGFLSGLGPATLFDLPWIPLYLALGFVFHFWIGLTATIGAIILVCLTFLTERMTRSSIKTSSVLGASRLGLLEAGRRNAEVLRSMGMTERLFARWNSSNLQYMAAQKMSSDIVGGLAALSKVLRMLLQSAVLAVGAYLAINQQATGGIMIAGSILTSRALAPVELAIAHWKNFASARQSWLRLFELIKLLAAPAPSMNLPAPVKEISVENVSVTPPGSQRLVAQNISFRLRAGDGLGIIGPSASGKSSLVRALVGVWPAVRGKVRLDNASLEQWNMKQLGNHIGYLPQDVELFDGTITENISRFDPASTSDDIIEAARAAGVHELVLRLSDGYETAIGEGGAALSAGQRQRIALARALYKKPFLLVLDEPNSNLDAEGDRALAQAIVATRRRGGIVIVVAHRQSTLAGLDLLLILANGQIKSFGPKDQVLKQATEQLRQMSQRATVLAETNRVQ